MSGHSSFIVEVTRGAYLESVHQVAACAVTAEGTVKIAFGNIDRDFPIRSLAKPFIAAELVRSGAFDAFSLGDTELAITAGSHDGEAEHVAAVRRFLSAIDIPETALLCGPALVGTTVVGPAIANNCSGKHAAVLAMCRHFFLDTSNYIAPDHPIQQYLLPCLLATFDRAPADTPIVTDGCGMPIFGASLRQIAVAFARFGTSNDVAARRVRDAVVAEPALIGGWSGNIDTRIVSWSDGTLIGKIGAEGLHADTVVGRDLGIAIKVQDGNSRAIPSTLARIFRELNLNMLEEQHLYRFANQIVRNASGAPVGRIHEIEEPVPASGPADGPL